MLRSSARRFGGVTSNMLAPPQSGRFFNPMTVWTACDILFPLFFTIGLPGVATVVLYGMWTQPTYSHFQDKNYYHKMPYYTKEFIAEYNRLERWRHY